MWLLWLFDLGSHFAAPNLKIHYKVGHMQQFYRWGHPWQRQQRRHGTPGAGAGTHLSDPTLHWWHRCWCPHPCLNLSLNPTEIKAISRKTEQGMWQWGYIIIYICYQRKPSTKEYFGKIEIWNILYAFNYVKHQLADCIENERLPCKLFL